MTAKVIPFPDSFERDLRRWEKYLDSSGFSPEELVEIEGEMREDSRRYWDRERRRKLRLA